MESASVKQGTVAPSTSEASPNGISSIQSPPASLPSRSSLLSTSPSLNNPTNSTQEGTVNVAVVVSASIAVAMTTLSTLLLVLMMTFAIVHAKKRLQKKKERKSVQLTHYNEDPLEINPTYFTKEPKANGQPDNVYEDVSEYVTYNDIETVVTQGNIAYGVMEGVKENIYSTISAR